MGGDSWTETGSGGSGRGFLAGRGVLKEHPCSPPLLAAGASFWPGRLCTMSLPPCGPASFPPHPWLRPLTGCFSLSAPHCCHPYRAEAGICLQGSSRAGPHGVGWVTVAATLSGTLKQALSKRESESFPGEPPALGSARGGRRDGEEPGSFPCSPSAGGGVEPTALPAAPWPTRQPPGLGHSGEACGCRRRSLGSLPPVLLPRSSIPCETISLC